MQKQQSARVCFRAQRKNRQRRVFRCALFLRGIVGAAQPFRSARVCKHGCEGMRVTGTPKSP